MNKILTIQQLENISKQLRNMNEKIVLAGGCFDILHIGHLTFLQKAKNQGDYLFVLLESDDQIKKIKGSNRPINTQKDRAEILAALQIVDYIIPLSASMSDSNYDTLIKKINPSVIATTKGDPNRFHKERQAKLIEAKVVDVTMPVKDHSTTNLLKLFEEL